MIYLIGGPPKCGKTTLAKHISKLKGIPWISTDTLQNVIKPYIQEKDQSRMFPTSNQREDNNDLKYSKYSTEEIIMAYQSQAKTIYDAIDMFVISEVTNGNDFTIEGYHIEPALVSKLEQKYPGEIKSVFLMKSDQNKFVANIKMSSTPNDWILARTHEDKTYNKIAKMICQYGEYFKKESEKHGLEIMNMDDNFEKNIDKALNILI